jgi:hypothetical protein
VQPKPVFFKIKRGTKEGSKIQKKEGEEDARSYFSARGRIGSMKGRWQGRAQLMKEKKVDWTTTGWIGQDLTNWVYCQFFALLQ